jgi:hypothetical protein
VTDPATLAFADLQPEDILATLTDLGFACDGRFLALNSYENRVYQVGIEDGKPIVAKFYRPGRWSDDAILEEHAFAAALNAQEIPVVPPLEHLGWREKSPGSGTVPGSISTLMEPSPSNTCSRTTLFLTTIAQPMKALSISYSMVLRHAMSAPAACVRSACTATSTLAMCW